MKNFIQIVLLFSLGAVFAQEKGTYIDVDDVIAIEIPGDVYVLDTVQNGMQMLQYGSEGDNGIFLIQRIKMKQISEPLPKERLGNVYKGLLAGHAKKFGDSGYQILKASEIEIGGEPARKVLYGKGKQSAAEFLFLIKGLYIYTVSYFNEKKFDDKVSTAFLSGMKVK